MLKAEAARKSKKQAMLASKRKNLMDNLTRERKPVKLIIPGHSLRFVEGKPMEILSWLKSERIPFKITTKSNS